MTVVRLKYHFLVFLYAYLRQIDLSLDRTRWDSWEHLVKYYKEHITPEEVLEQLMDIEQKAAVSDQDNKSGILYKGINPIYRLFRSKVLFQKSELLKCIELLEKFNTLLSKEFKDYPKEAELVRVEIAKYYSLVLGANMYGKDLKRCMLVEHFFQNENLKTIKIEVFASDNLTN